MNPKTVKPTLQTKGRNKKNDKFLSRTNGTSRPDLSNLRKPIDTSVSDLCQVSELLKDGTDEVKSILSHECNIIYECRICKSLFRSIVNLVSHKREYCRDKFDSLLHGHVLNHLSHKHSARDLIIHMYKTDEQTSNNDSIKNDRILRSQVSKEPNKKDLSAIIEMLNKKQEEYIEKQLENENALSNVSDNRRVYLEPIDTNCNSAVYPVESSKAIIDTIDLVKEQITKLQDITDQNVLAVEEQPENQMEKSDSPIQANMSDEENESLIYRLSMNNLSCSICNAKFSSKKTLIVHIKTLHTSKRLCYPCPCCTNTFANTWSVYRHLYKVHKKTNEQVRKLRSQIQERAFHRKTTVMKGRKNLRAAKTTALKDIVENTDKTQESTSHIESNKKLCGRRGRKPNKKTSTYLQYHQTPVAACDETTIRIKQCNTLLNSTFNDMPCETEGVNLENNTIIELSNEDVSSKSSGHTSSSFENCDLEISCVQNVANFSKEDWDRLKNEHDDFFERNSTDNNNESDITSESIDDSKLLSQNLDNCTSDENLQSSDMCIDANEVSPVSTMKSGKEEAPSHPNENQSTDSEEIEKIEAEEDSSELQSSCSPQSNGENRTLLMERKIATLADFRKLRCLLCKRKFTTLPNLRRHMAMHVGWNRYRCKLCDFKCFVKSECVVHCNKVHNMWNRTNIAEMIFTIPQDGSNEDGCDANVTDEEIKSDNLDIAMDVTVCQPELCVSTKDSSDSDTCIISRNEAIAAANEQVARVEHQNIDLDNSDKTAEMQDLSECKMDGKKLDDNPELKRMVMEVIFGSTEAQADSDDVLDTSDEASQPVDTNDNVNNVAIIDETKEAFCPVLNNVKRQRPIRNRIKPLNDDFVYDLREVVHRKESALINDSENLHIRKKAKLHN